MSIVNAVPKNTTMLQWEGNNLPEFQAWITEVASKVVNAGYSQFTDFKDNVNVSENDDVLTITSAPSVNLQLNIGQWLVAPRDYFASTAHPFDVLDNSQVNYRFAIIHP